MLARDIMQRDVFTVRDDQPVETLIDLMVQEHIHGCPVVDAQGELVGVVTQQDVFFSEATHRQAPPAGMTVRDLMTSPAVSAEEDTEIVGLGRMMLRLRIHRIPIVKDGKVTGIVSSLDLVGQLIENAECR
jgi:CBS domain-containing protein